MKGFVVLCAMAVLPATAGAAATLLDCRMEPKTYSRRMMISYDLSSGEVFATDRWSLDSVGGPVRGHLDVASDRRLVFSWKLTIHSQGGDYQRRFVAFVDRASGRVRLEGRRPQYTLTNRGACSARTIAGAGMKGG